MSTNLTKRTEIGHFGKYLLLSFYAILFLSKCIVLHIITKGGKRMKKLFLILLSIILLLSVSLPSLTNQNIAHAQTEKVTVLADVVNLREGPGLTYQVIQSVKKGDELTYIERQGDWYKVQTGSTKAWIASWLVEKNDKNNANSKKTAGIVVAQIDHLNIRQEPSISSPMLAQLFTGNEANYLKEEGNWVQIQFGKLVGWVSKDYITIVTTKTDSIETNAVENTKKSTATSLNYVTINVDAVNVRKKADLNSKKIDVVYRNSSFKVLDEKNGWLEIEYKEGKKGWVNGLYGTRSTTKQNTSAKTDAKSTVKNTITIIYNGTNLREQPTTASAIVQRVDAGNRFEVVAAENDWYKIKLTSGKTAYVANWVVTTDEDKATSNNKSNTQKPNRKKDTLNGLTIVVDAGHGGNDHGTTGKRGTDEKDITLLTAALLKAKLQSAGAKVIMTRDSDIYVGLKNRVSISNNAKTDAFISIHYDATQDSSVSGVTTYYTKSSQKQLAEYVQKGLARKVELRDRGAQPGNYYVLRENQRNAILIELGFLSNPNEERKVTTDYYREQATLGIYQGIVNYFNAQLEQ